MKVSLRLPVFRGRGLADIPLRTTAVRMPAVVAHPPPPTTSKLQTGGLLAGLRRFARSFQDPRSLAGRVLCAPAFMMMGIPTEGPARAPLGALQFTVAEIVQRIRYFLGSNEEDTTSIIMHDLNSLLDLAALEPSATQRDAILSQLIGLALDAAERFSDEAFLTLAHTATQNLSASKRIQSEAYVDAASRDIRVVWVHRNIHQELREAITAAHEIRAEEAVERASADMIRKGYLQIVGGTPPARIMVWALGQVAALFRTLQGVAVSREQRNVAHDIRGALTSFVSELRLADMEGHLTEIFHPDHHVTTSRDLSTLVGYMGLVHYSAKKVRFEGFDNEALADQSHMRLLKTILNNLISNARDHPRPGQDHVRIRVALIRINGNRRIVVEDDGAGMPPDVAAMLLSGVPIHNGLPVDHASPGEAHGFGWLRIREACDALGIIHEIVSTPGKGTLVTLRLPRGFLASDSSKMHR